MWTDVFSSLSSLPTLFHSSFNPPYLFFWGCVGSSASELVMLLRYLGSGRQLPGKYSRPAFWLARLSLIPVAGLLAVATQVQTPLLAMELGIAAPVIISSLAQKVPSLS